VSAEQRDYGQSGQVRRRRQRRSGGATFVMMMQAADGRDGDDRAAGWRLGNPRDGRIFSAFVIAWAVSCMTIFVRRDRISDPSWVVMLVSEHSASAAEMVAASASEYRLAMLGRRQDRRTSGRDQCLQVWPAPSGRVAGCRVLHMERDEPRRHRVVPTIKEPIPTEGLLNGQDTQLRRAVQCLQDGVAA
jgi:hypothetical protein